MENCLYLRIKELCDEHNITISALENALGFGTSTILKWKNSQRQMIDKVIMVARYFDVSVDYLIGNTETRSSADTILADPQIISMQRAKERATDVDWNRSYHIMKVSLGRAFDDED